MSAWVLRFSGLMSCISCVAAAAGLHIMDENGIVYTAVEIPDGAYVMQGEEEIAYTEESINTCRQMTLPAGRYKIYVKGGRGGGDRTMASGIPAYEGDSIIHTVNIDTPTDVYVFRGGDGADNCDNLPDAQYSFTVGTGSSGVDSLVVIGDTVLRASGGAGVHCFSSNRGSSYTEGYPGTGTGNHTINNYYSQPLKNGRWGLCIRRENIYTLIRGGGGGGVVGGVGQSRGTTCPSVSVFDACNADGADCAWYVTNGTAATDDTGGRGGDATLSYRGVTATGHGAAGGKNVSWTCGGATAVSYGGGGAPGQCMDAFLPKSASDTPHCGDGIAGGSGSTGTSDTSYVKIYRL